MAKADIQPGGPDPLDLAAGQRLRSLRKERGLSQPALAEALGITFQQIQKYERGANRMSAAVIVKLAQALCVPASALLPEADGVVGEPEILGLIARFRGGDELVRAYARIRSAQLRRALLQMARNMAGDIKMDG
jgi:transcriptional regulator with XRE-family HTH domain